MKGGHRPDSLHLVCDGVDVVIESRHLHYHPDPQDASAEWRVRECSSLEVRVSPIEADCHVWLGDEREPARNLGRGVAFCTVSGGNFVGTSRLRVDVGGRTIAEVPLEIYSEKANYRTDYRKILDALSERVASLAFTGVSPTTAPAAWDRGEGPPILTYLVLQYLMHPRRLPAALQRIARHPDRRLYREVTLQEFSQSRNITDRTLRHLVSDSRHLRRDTNARLPLLRGHTPERLLDQRTRIDYATPPNRFLALTLQTLDRRLRRLESTFSAHPKPRLQEIARDCGRWGRRVAGFRRQPFLEELTPATRMPFESTVLQRHESYRAVRDAWFRLQGTARVRWGELERIVAGPNKDLATLYEYWCFFALADALARTVGKEPDWRAFTRTESDLLEVRLVRGQPSELKIKPFRLVYEPRIRKGSYSVPLKPDFLIRGEGGLWVFDAKYRLDQGVVVAAAQDELTRRTRNFVREDLYKMHTYRDALRSARSAFILYPGEEFVAFPVHGARARSVPEVEKGFRGVGAVPLLPDRLEALDQLLKRLL